MHHYSGKHVFAAVHPQCWLLGVWLFKRGVAFYFGPLCIEFIL